MSRFEEYDDYDVDSILAGGRWIARRNKVLKGRPGREALRKLERALVLMPRKRLIQSTLCDKSDVCVIGAWLYRQYVDDGMTPRLAWAKLREGRGRWDGNYEELERTIEKGSVDLGITRTLAEVVSYMNDEEEGWRARSPEGLYNLVLHWVRQYMAPDPLPQPTEETP